MTDGPDKGALQAMCCDYGFRSGFGRLYQGGDGEIPKNLFELVGPYLLPGCQASLLASG